MMTVDPQADHSLSSGNMTRSSRWKEPRQTKTTKEPTTVTLNSPSITIKWRFCVSLSDL